MKFTYSGQVEKVAVLAKRIERGFAKANKTAALPHDSVSPACAILEFSDDPLEDRHSRVDTFARFFGRKNHGFMSYVLFGE